MNDPANRTNLTDRVKPPVAPPDESKYYHDPGGHKRRARAKRIDDLMAAAGGPRGAVDRAYWALVYDHEEAPMTTDAVQLRAACFELPEPSTLDDAQLTAKLGALLEELDRMNVVVCDYEHVSERKLYELLVGRLLHEERPDIPMKRDQTWVVDVSMMCPPEDVEGEALL